MAQRIIQLLSAPESARTAYYNHEGKVDLYPPTCIALVEKGSNQDVVYMETVDNEIKEVDITDPNFMGIIAADDTEAFNTLQLEAKNRFNGKSK